MHGTPSSAVNSLLLSLPATSRRRLLARCLKVELAAGQVLGEPGTLIPHLYFPIDCLVTLAAGPNAKERIAVGLVGHDGMLGITQILGVQQELMQWRVQGAGLAWKIATRNLLAEAGRNPALRRALHRYLYVTLAFLTLNAACQRLHVVEARLASWLLMTRDRTPRPDFHVTHESLARTMGVRRAGISRAAGALQRRGLIHYHRGDQRIVDARGLEKAACACYAANLQIQFDIMGGAAKGSA